MSKAINIIIVETSSVIYEGLSGILTKSGMPVHIIHTGNLCEAEKFILNYKRSLIIINPTLIQNNIKLFNSLKSEFGNTRWIAFVYVFHEQHLLSLFDDIITVSDSPDTIISAIKKTLASGTGKDSDQEKEVLSERETEVLQLMATGNSNKEIADKLNISINTVMTHRKNISQKTSIKSISGLTIYAVVKKIITLDNLH